MIKVNDPQAIEKISRASNVVYSPKAHLTISRHDASGDVLGGFIYSDFHVRSVSAHVAGFRPRWLNRALLAAAFDFPFNGLGVSKVILTIPESNDKSLRFCYSLGFQFEAAITDVYPDGGMIITSMYRDQCRFLNLL